MPESPKYKSNQFSLVLIIPGHKPKFVNIPKAKRSYRNEKTSGITTYQMAIDAYTTKFNNKDELLNDIRENGYATIKNISNDKISVYIIYKGQCSNTFDDTVAYKKDTRLVNFIENNEVSGGFSRFKDQYNSDTFNLIEDFKEDAYNRFYNYQYSEEYRKYLEKNQGIEQKSIYRALQQGVYEDSLKRNNYTFRNDLPFYEYFNIRKHLLTDYKELEISFIRERYKNIPPNEKAEAYKDYLQDLEKTEERYSPFRKQKFSEMTVDNYTKDPEEEMQEYNNPSYNEDMEIQNNEKEFIADRTEYIYSNLDYEENNQSILPINKTRRR